MRRRMAPAAGQAGRGAPPRPLPRYGRRLRGVAPGRLVAGVILAAGQSRRMGQPKQLMRIGSQTMLERVVDAAVDAGLGEVHVVLGYRAEAIRASLAGRPVHFTLNTAYQEGLGSSVRAGAAALSPDADAAIFLLADQPGITSAAIRQLIARGTPQNIVCASRSEEHTSELQSRGHLVCRLLLECYGHHRDLHSFPTRRSSDLLADQPGITSAAIRQLIARGTPQNIVCAS